MKLDPLDHAIIAALQQNGRMSNREVGREVGVSEGTIRQRLRKLEAAKAIRLGLVVDSQSAGLETFAWVRIKARPRQVRAVARQLAQLDICGFVGLTLGPYDIVALVLMKSRAELGAVIEQRIAKIEGIVAVDVREPTASIKHRYDLVRIP
jgi:Lrp/AsnC family transcriptional regulator for asnA, asnC and gidA